MKANVTYTTGNSVTCEFDLSGLMEGLSDHAVGNYKVVVEQEMRLLLAASATLWVRAIREKPVHPTMSAFMVGFMLAFPELLVRVAEIVQRAAENGSLSWEDVARLQVSLGAKLPEEGGEGAYTISVNLN